MDPPNNKLQPEEQQENEESFDAHLENWHQSLSSENAPISTKRRKTNTTEHQNTRIVRSTGRKDRHSKVYTSRGPKDRRLRLSPRTAIQFYDVQDRLGCDRPSKAIDWLMKEAKIAIDGLDVQNVKNNPTSSSRVFANGNVPIQDSLLSLPFQDSLLSHIFDDDDDDVEIDRLQRIFNWNHANEIENSVFINDSQISNEFPGVNFYGEELSNFTATVKDDEK